MVKRYRIVEIAPDICIIEQRIFFVWCDIDPFHIGYNPRISREQALRKFSQLTTPRLCRILKESE